MDDQLPRAEAVAVDPTTGKIVAVGTLAECQAAAPDAEVRDLGDTVLMPGFIEAHSHPMVAGLYTQDPSHWISASQGYTDYSQVQKLWRELDANTPAGEPVLCYGLERLTQGAPELTNLDLDEYFPNRPAVILDISGHEVYFNSATIAFNGWQDGHPPADPPVSRFGRNADGTSNGRAYETAAVEAAAGKVQQAVVSDPLQSVARWYGALAAAGVTTSSDHAFDPGSLPGYEALATSGDCPIRVVLYQPATDPKCVEPLVTTAADDRLWKAGVKIWSDGTTFCGTIAASFPFLDNETTRNAQIPLGPTGDSTMNYTRLELEETLDTVVKSGLQVATHAHGDVAIDVALDAYAAVLSRNGLLGTDHRWRIEHWSAGRADQFRRAVDLGISTPLATYQFILLGNLLDGTLFTREVGARWVAVADAIKAGATVSFHSDSPVAPVNPLNTIQCMTTRRPEIGGPVGVDQMVSLHDALRAQTINAAYHLRAEDVLGSISVGKLADFVELSADPYTVDVAELTDQVKVLGTWSGGHKIDIPTFMDDVASVDPDAHKNLHNHAKSKCC